MWLYREGWSLGGLRKLTNVREIAFIKTNALTYCDCNAQVANYSTLLDMQIFELEKPAKN